MTTRVAEDHGGDHDWLSHIGTRPSRLTLCPHLEVERYYTAVKRYFLGVLHDADAAEELAQEFAVRFCQGDFQHKQPELGRFRDYLKTCLRNMAHDWWRTRQTEGARMADLDSLDGIAATDDLGCDEILRFEILSRTWKSLATYQKETGKPYHTILRQKADHPEWITHDLAEELGRHCRPAPSVEATRQLLHRARVRFTELLVAEVSLTLRKPDDAAIQRELAQLKLLEYCRPVLGL